MRRLSSRYESVEGRAPFSAETLLRPVAVAQSVCLLIGLFVAVQVLANFTTIMGMRLEQNGLLPRTPFAAHLGREIVIAVYHYPQIIALYVVGFIICPLLFRVNAAQYVLTEFLASVILAVLFFAILVAVTAPTVVPRLMGATVSYMDIGQMN
jgi:hypothetical protein